MWTCAGCGESHTEDADICWNCGTDRDGRPDPQFRRADEPDPPVPVATICPDCSSTAYHPVRPAAWVAYMNDRVCEACGTRYTPPTPRWAAVLFLVNGGLFTIGAGLNLLILVLVGCPSVLALVVNLAFLTHGLAAVSHGVRALARPGHV